MVVVSNANVKDKRGKQQCYMKFITSNKITLYNNYGTKDYMF